MLDYSIFMDGDCIWLEIKPEAATIYFGVCHYVLAGLTESSTSLVTLLSLKIHNRPVWLPPALHALNWLQNAPDVPWTARPSCQPGTVNATPPCFLHIPCTHLWPATGLNRSTLRLTGKRLRVCASSKNWLCSRVVSELLHCEMTWLCCWSKHCSQIRQVQSTTTYTTEPSTRYRLPRFSTLCASEQSVIQMITSEKFYKIVLTLTVHPRLC